MKKINSKDLLTIKNVSLAFLVILFFSPVLLYAYQFGIGLWSTHQEWAEMGSAIGGLYSPILASATLLLLYKQYGLQKKGSAEGSQARLSDNLLSHGLSALSEIKAKHNRDSLMEYAHIVHDANKLAKGEPQTMLFGEHSELTFQLTQVFHNMYQLGEQQGPYSQVLLNNLRGEIITVLPPHLLMQFDKNYLGERVETVKPYFYRRGF